MINLEVEKIRPLKAKLQDASSDDRRFQERLRNNNINLEEFSLDYRVIWFY